MVISICTVCNRRLIHLKPTNQPINKPVQAQKTEQDRENLESHIHSEQCPSDNDAAKVELKIMQICFLQSVSESTNGILHPFYLSVYHLEGR